MSDPGPNNATHWNNLVTKLLLLGFALDEPGEGPPNTPLPISMSFRSASMSASGSGSEFVVGLPPLPVAPGLTPFETGIPYEPSKKPEKISKDSVPVGGLVGLSLRGSPDTLRFLLWPMDEDGPALGTSNPNMPWFCTGLWLWLCDL